MRDTNISSREGTLMSELSRNRIVLVSVLGILGLSTVVGAERPWHRPLARRLDPEPTTTSVPTESMVEAYKRAERETDAEARGIIGVIAFGVLLFGLLAFALDNVAAGPMPDPTGTKMLHTLAQVVDAFSQLGIADPLTSILTIFGVEAGLAIAQASTKLDPTAIPRDVLATERLLNVLRGCSCILAASVCLIAAGSLIAMMQQHQMPAAEPVVLATTIASCTLAMAMVDRSDALIAQVGIAVQMDRTEEALARLTAAPTTRGVRLLLAGAGPMLVLLSAAFYRLVHDGVEGFLACIGVTVAAVVWLGLSLTWARSGLGSQAARWAHNKRFSGIRLLVCGYVTVGLVAVCWLLFAVALAWVLSSNYTWFAVLAVTLFVWPMGCLAIDSAPRLQVRRSSHRIHPTSASADRARAMLTQRQSDLSDSLEKWKVRAGQRPLLPPDRSAR